MLRNRDIWESYVLLMKVTKGCFLQIYWFLPETTWEDHVNKKYVTPYTSLVIWCFYARWVDVFISTASYFHQQTTVHFPPKHISYGIEISLMRVSVRLATHVNNYLRKQLQLSASPHTLYRRSIITRHNTALYSKHDTAKGEHILGWMQTQIHTCTRTSPSRSSYGMSRVSNSVKMPVT